MRSLRVSVGYTHSLALACHRPRLTAGSERVSHLREIEVKYQVADLGELEAALLSRDLVLSSAVHQDDQAYAQDGWHYGLSKLGVSFARLRTQDGRHLF